MPTLARLTFLGAINWDTTIFVERLPTPGAEEPVLRVEEEPGGKGANAAVAAAKIMGRGRVAMIGALGDDGFGPPLRRSLREGGVATEGVVVVHGRKSGRAYVVVDAAGRKEIHTHFGANDALSPEHLLSPGGSRAIASSKGVAVMDIPLRAAISAELAAKKAGARVVYSPGVRGNGPGAAVSRALSLADDVVLDAPELASMTGVDDMRVGVRRLAEKTGVENVVATRGPAGCMVSAGGDVFEVPGVALGPLGLKAVNTTGCGDAFIAAYAWRVVLGDSPRKAAEWGNLAGALKVANPLTRGSPTGEELSKRMGSLKGVRVRRLG